MYAEFGSIHSDSLLLEDLIPAFMETLDDLKEQSSLTAGIDSALTTIERHQNDPDYYKSETAQYDHDTLSDLLTEFAPPFGYFGAHPGDGADFGFWINQDELDDAVCDGEVLRLEDGDEWPTDVSDYEYVLEVNDHHNITLYTPNHEEVWSLV